MSDAWDEIQAVKSKRNSFRERLEKRKKERLDILGTSSGTSTSPLPTKIAAVSNISSIDSKPESSEIFKTIENGNCFPIISHSFSEKKTNN